RVERYKRFPAGLDSPGDVGTEQRFVSVGRKEIDRCALHVQREDTQSLNGVDKEMNATLPTQRSDVIQVIAKAAGELDPAEADHARAAVERRTNVVDPEPAVAARYGAHLDAAIGQVHPGINVGRVFFSGGNDVVASLPGIAFGHDADALAGI